LHWGMTQQDDQQEMLLTPRELPDARIE